MIRSYTELCLLRTFEERYEYLRLTGTVGQVSFGHDRHMNQLLYHSVKWRSLRERIMIRDNGCDLGVPGYEVVSKAVIHHINPITKDQLIHSDPLVFNPNNLILTSHKTHMAIHYGDENLLPKPINIRKPNDTIPWR